MYYLKNGFTLIISLFFVVALLPSVSFANCPFSKVEHAIAMNKLDQQEAEVNNAANEAGDQAAQNYGTFQEFAAAIDRIEEEKKSQLEEIMKKRDKLLQDRWEHLHPYPSGAIPGDIIEAEPPGKI